MGRKTTTGNPLRESKRTHASAKALAAAQHLARRPHNIIFMQASSAILAPLEDEEMVSILGSFCDKDIARQPAKTMTGSASKNGSNTRGVSQPEMKHVSGSEVNSNSSCTGVSPVARN